MALRGSGLELALLEWGEAGPLVLLHHANGFCAGVWGPVAAALGRSHRVVALDARGHGASDKPRPPQPYRWDAFVQDTAELARTLSHERGGDPIALAVGHSFGGTASLGAAAAHPELFERLLLVDPVIPAPGASPGHPERRRRGRALAAGARRRRRAWASREEAIASWSKRRFFASWDPRVLALYARYGLRERADASVELACPPEVEAAVFESSGSFDVFAAAPRVACPTRILWAARGDFPRPVYEALAAEMADARVVDVASGHLVPMEQPEIVVEAALGLLAQAPRPRPGS